jgi:hypothetical protein
MVGLYYFYFIFKVMAQLSVINLIVTIIKYNLRYMSYFIPFVTVSWAITVAKLGLTENMVYPKIQFSIGKMMRIHWN